MKKTRINAHFDLQLCITIFYPVHTVNSLVNMLQLTGNK